MDDSMHDHGVTVTLHHHGRSLASQCSNLSHR
jgi:hypothetical protein